MKNSRLSVTPGPGDNRRRPAFALGGLACAVLAYPVGRIAAEVLVTGEDLLGYYSVWVGILAFLITLVVGIVLTGWSFLRKEHPRMLSIIAAAANLALLALLIGKLT